AEGSELIGHRPGQHGHLGRADVGREPCPPGRHRRPGQVEYHEPGNGAEFDDFRITLEFRPRYACHAPIMTGPPPAGRLTNHDDGASLWSGPPRWSIVVVRPGMPRARARLGREATAADRGRSR